MVFDNIGVHYFSIKATLQDTTLFYERIWKFELTYGCNAISLLTTNPTNLGTFYVGIDAEEAWTNVQNTYFTNPTGCQPTYTLTYGDADIATAAPWISYTIDYTDLYAPTV